MLTDDINSVKPVYKNNYSEHCKSKVKKVETLYSKINRIKRWEQYLLSGKTTLENVKRLRQTIGVQVFGAGITF